MIYVFLDTCVIVDCAYTRHEKANPTLLDKVIECCESSTAKLLLSEVVLLELDRVSKARAEEVEKVCVRLRGLLSRSLRKRRSGLTVGRRLWG